MRTALFISAISFYVQILKFGTLVYCLTEIVRNVKVSRLNLLYWIVGIGSAVFCPLFGVFKFIDTGNISLQQVENLQEFAAFTAGTIGGYFVACGFVISLYLRERHTMGKVHIALWLGAVIDISCYIYGLMTGDTLPIDVASMSALAAGLGVAMFHAESKPFLVKHIFLGMMWISFSLLARERAPNFAYLSSSDIYELLIIVGYWYLSKVPIIAERGISNRDGHGD
eukprot:TRINITY_DN5534_c0_g1_i1.p1 TRINITY_DN5534_c0_g1~~TRINITY_DN5534_c0_g1_i1.p1  ORF type:complete len:226 (+),score=27.47 TRINITY_DN5534_c0_g1_i1:154-831(+)